VVEVMLARVVRRSVKVRLLGVIVASMLVLLAAGLGVAQTASTSQGQDEAVAAAVGDTFELAVGDTAMVAETGLQVTLRAVPEDSRCPAQVNCIWAGRVTVEVEVQAPDEAAETFALSTCCPASVTARHTYAGQSIDLIDVTPAPPPFGGRVAQQDYRAQLSVAASPPIEGALR
jgi:hypothetical protein